MNKFKKFIKFNFIKVIITIILMVAPAFIIKALVESMPITLDEKLSMETAYKYFTYVSLPQYPIQLVKRVLTSTCKLVAPPSDDIFRCYGKFMSIISLLLSVAYNYFLACLIYLGFEKLFKKKSVKQT